MHVSHQNDALHRDLLSSLRYEPSPDTANKLRFVVITGIADYGYLWWLNTDGMTWPGLSSASFGAQGAGNNTIWIDPEHDLVIVWRWHDGNPSEFFKRVVASIRR